MSRAMRRYRAGGISRKAASSVAAVRGMHIHDFEFVVRQRPRLEQHAIRNAHLADVMQRAGEIDQADEIGVHYAAESWLA